MGITHNHHWVGETYDPTRFGVKGHLGVIKYALLISTFGGDIFYASRKSDFYLFSDSNLNAIFFFFAQIHPILACPTWVRVDSGEGYTE